MSGFKIMQRIHDNVHLEKDGCKKGIMCISKLKKLENKLFKLFVWREITFHKRQMTEWYKFSRRSKEVANENRKCKQYIWFIYRMGVTVGLIRNCGLFF